MTEERTDKLLGVLNKRQTDLAVVIENVHDPHNISAVMRTCDAVGIQDIYVLTTKIATHKKFGARCGTTTAKPISFTPTLAHALALNTNCACARCRQMAKNFWAKAKLFFTIRKNITRSKARNF